MLKMLLLLFAAIPLAAAGFTLAATARHPSTEPPGSRGPDIAVPFAAAARLAGAIRIPTISVDDPEAFDAEAFQRLHAYLEASFPLVHSRLRREVISTYSLLYTWEGDDPSAAPIVLLGHMDVVPVEPGVDDGWTEPPFGGRIVGGFIWGRGAIDNKSAVLGTLEAVEMLLAEGFRPVRTVYLAYGHDEEVGGAAGAREIAALLTRRGVKPVMVVDEGGIIGDGVLGDMRVPVALIGIAEKGFLTIELTARATGGHASLPPAQGAVGIVSAAVARVEQNPMPPKLDGATRQMFDRVAPELPVLQRVMFANQWLTGRLLLRRLQEHPTTNAMVRTTAAPTIFQAGTKDNILPSHARAVINVRILPGDSTVSVLEHLRRVIDDERVAIKKIGRFSAEPSRVSSTDSEGFRILERAIRNIVPEAIVAPYLVVVATDARYYAELSDDVFRFVPLRLTSRDLQRMHGIDERVGVREYETAIRTYRQLLVNASWR